MHETECGKVDDFNPKFKETKIDSQVLTNCDRFRKIKIELVHHTSQDEDIYQDECFLTIDKIANGRVD